MKTSKTTLDQGRENELIALRAIGTVGWLSIKQVASWLYPGRAQHTATNKAARVLARLVANGEVKCRDEKSEKRRDGINFGIGYYVLTPQGACRANEGLTTEVLESGLELSQLDIGRQAVAVEFLMRMRREGHQIIGAASARRCITRALQQAERLAPGEKFDAVAYAAYAESVKGTQMDPRLLGADGLLIGSLDEAATVVLVVRNLHTQLIKKARRLSLAAENIELLGHPWIVKEFRKILGLESS